jgi:hypothetical protein
MGEGELKKCLASLHTEMLWRRYANNHRKQNGSFPHQNEYITEILDEARKEFPKKSLDSDSNYIMYETEEIDVWLLKWFGGE